MNDANGYKTKPVGMQTSYIFLGSVGRCQYWQACADLGCQTKFSVTFYAV